MTDRPIAGSHVPSLDAQLRYTRRSSVYVSRGRSMEFRPHVPKTHIATTHHNQVKHVSVPHTGAAKSLKKPYADEASVLAAAKQARDKLPQVSKPTTHKMAAAQVAYNTDHGLINDMVHRQRRLNTPPSIPRQQPPKVVAKETLEKKTKRTKFKLLNRGNALTGMACLVFIVGLAVSVYSMVNNHRVTEQVQALSSGGAASDNETTSGGEAPDETPIPSHVVSKYQVSSDLPRLLTIKKLGVHSRIKPLNVSRDNELLAPKSIWDAGWYNASAKPGQDAGAVVLDGHVGGPTRGGIFVGLKKLAAGDMIDIERGDGRVVHYRVVRTEKLAAGQVDMRQLLTSVQPGKQGLNLITCAGAYNAKTQMYDDRTTVFSVQVD